METSKEDDESIIGDECHIISGAQNGPRYDTNYPSDQVDGYSNFILLCKVHHKLIDDQYSTYAHQKLVQIKAEHEKWVSKQLDNNNILGESIRIKKVPGNTPAYLSRITTGKKLLEVVLNACAFSFDHDDLDDPAHVDLISGFLQNAQDWGDIGFDNIGDKVKIGYEISEIIKELEVAGFWVFGGREVQALEGGSGGVSDWPVATLRVLRSNNDEIVKTPVGEKGV